MNKDKEVRAYMCDVSTRTDEAHGNVLEGIPIVYDVATDIGGMWKEIIDRGALDGADLKDVRFLINHDVDSIPLARSRNNNENSTMQMTVEPDGMHIRVDLDTENNPRAKELYSAVKRKDMSGMSFMFTIKGDGDGKKGEASESIVIIFNASGSDQTVNFYSGGAPQGTNWHVCIDKDNAGTEI